MWRQDVRASGKRLVGEKGLASLPTYKIAPIHPMSALGRFRPNHARAGSGRLARLTLSIRSAAKAAWSKLKGQNVFCQKMPR